MKYLKIILLLNALIFSKLILAADAKVASPLNLYDQPNDKAKIVATIPAGQAVMPIFNQGDWIKIADPSNGNVGWVEKKMLNQQGFPSIYVQTSGEKSKNGQSSEYQVIQLSIPSKDQIQAIMQNFQVQQKQFQQLFNQMMQQNISEVNRMIKIQPEVVPVMQPVILMPTHSQNTKPTSGSTQP